MASSQSGDSDRPSKPPQVVFQQPGPYYPQQQQQQPLHGSLYMQQPPQPQQVVVMAAAPHKFQDYPLRMQCPHCFADVITAMEFRTGGLTWLVAGGICLVGAPLGLFLGCCLIPFCVNGLKDAEHSCPSCGHVVGKYRRLG